MCQSTPSIEASTLRQRAARVRFLAEQIGDPRYATLMFDAAQAYEMGAIEADSHSTLPRYAAAAE